MTLICLSTLPHWTGWTVVDPTKHWRFASTSWERETMGKDTDSTGRRHGQRSDRNEPDATTANESRSESLFPAAAINEEAARALEELADLLKKHWPAYNQDGKLGVKIASYRKAAAQLRRFNKPIGENWREGTLETIPGIGPAIAKKLGEFLERGSFRLLDELRELDSSPTR